MTDDYDPFTPGEEVARAAELTTIDLEFETVRRFREDMAPYLNYDGCFARSKTPLARDTEVLVRFLLPEGFVLAQGNAVVAWLIDPETNPELVPGMALRFTALDQQAKELIDELVDFHIATGGDPFDLGPGASEPGDIPTDALVGGGIEISLAADTPTVPMPPAEPEPTPEATKRDEVLPNWLSEVAKESNFEVTLEDEAASPDPPLPRISPSDDLSPLLAELEIKLVDEEEPVEAVPARPSVKAAVNIPKKGSGNQKAPRDIRLGLLVAAAIVLVAVSALLWSVLTGQKGDAVPEEGLAVTEETLLVEEPGDAAEIPEASPPGKGLVLEEPPVDTPIPEPVPDRQATRVLDIMAAARGDATTVTIRGDGYFDERSLRVSLLKDPARVWLRVKKIETSYRPNEIEVGSPQVLRVRVGHHTEENPPSLWVVLDLADDSMAVVDRKVDGNSIQLTVGRR